MAKTASKKPAAKTAPPATKKKATPAKAAPAKASASKAAAVKKPASKSAPAKVVAPKAKSKAPAAKKWTILVYLAGDNNLDGAGVTDIGEMKKVGSDANINVLVQFDRAGSKGKTTRYCVKKGTTLSQDAVQVLGETNTGDPAVLQDFLTWGITNYPADHYMVVLWNHGAGWDDSNVYAGDAFGGAAPPVVRKGQTIAGKGSKGALSFAVARAGVRRARRALFRTTVAKVVTTRAVAFDDQAQDFLDNGEMKRVLTAVKKSIKRKIDIVGFDACLMSMAEVAYQIRGAAAYTVGSEQSEPNDGWPYDRVLAALAAKPTMTPADLGKEIVKQYIASYGKNDNVTLAATDLAAIPDVAAGLDQLGKALLTVLKQANGITPILVARQQVQDYEPPYDEYVDLLDLCKLFDAQVKTPAVTAACKAITTALDKAVIASGNKGPGVANSNGLSVYFPKKRLCSLYATLDITKRNSWDDFLKAYVEKAGKRP